MPVRPAFIFAIGLAATCVGCISPESYAELERENISLHESIDAIHSELAAGQVRIDALDEQVKTLQNLGPARLEKLFTPVRVAFASRTGGVDLDGKPGDDGIVVYLQPIDSDGHVIKAAGTIRIQLFDLANPEGRREIAPYTLSIDQARKQWYGRFGTRHYTIKCPWPPGRVPDHRNITVLAEFTDYLTGRVLTCQDRFAITFPPGHSE